jgi:hypothetical protein
MCDCIGVVHNEHAKYLTQRNHADAERIGSEVDVCVGQMVESIKVTSANIDTLIDSLPQLLNSSCAQDEEIRSFEVQDDQAAQALKETTAQAEAQLLRVREALRMLSQIHYKVSSGSA